MSTVVEMTPERRSGTEGAAALPPAAPSSPQYRLADVVAELRRIAALAPGDDSVAEACRRAERLLENLHRQFVNDVIVGRPAAH